MREIEARRGRHRAPRLGYHAEAADVYREALTLVGKEPERRFLKSRVAAARTVNE